jgi:polyisoprenoid-binding protein YceI
VAGALTSGARGLRALAARALALTLARAITPAAVVAQAPVVGVPGPVPVPYLRLASGTLRFEADATVGDFSGVTSAVTGELRGATAPGLVHGWVEAPVRSLRTGIRRRDGHMYAAMDADRYPTLRFEPRSLTASTRDDSASVQLTGTLTIHGVSRPVTVPLTAVRDSAGVRVVGAFPLDVGDFGIRDGLVRMGGLLRVDPHVRIRIDLTFVAPPPQTADGWP